MTCDNLRDKFDAYIDSELTTTQLAEFESHLRDCASCATGALGMMQMKRMTRAAGTRYTPSPEFRARMEKQIRSNSKSAAPSWFPKLTWVPKFAMAAAAALLLVASVTLWVNNSGRERAYAELTDMHVAALASANPVDVVSTDQHTVKPWFAGKLPFTFNLPELQNTGFTLAGGRVAYFQHNPGAQLIFDVRKHQLSVFIFREQSGDDPFHAWTSSSDRLAFHTETWSEGGLRYFIVSDASASDVHSLGELMKHAARS